MRIKGFQKLIDKIRGKEALPEIFSGTNELIHKGEEVESVKGIDFVVKGENNKIIVFDNESNPYSYINNSLIHIQGNNNTIIFKKGAYGGF